MAGSGNVVSLAAQRALQVSQAKLATSFSRLSSGLRIVSASDDAAGLGVSDAMRAQVRSLTQASRNASDGISLLQTAEGGLSAVSANLARMGELAVQAASGLLTDADRASLDTEFKALRDEIDRTAASTSFNGVSLLDGSLASTGVSVQIGTDAATTARVDVTIDGAASVDLGGGTPLSGATLSTAADARAALGILDAGGASVARSRAGIGIGITRLKTTGQSVAAAIENLTAAASRISDVDVAQASADLIKNQILQKAGVAVLAQGNQNARVVLKLLG
jgi:flagellin